MRGQKPTGSARSPRMIEPSWRQAISDGAQASARPGRRRRSVPKAIRASSRASGAPRQKWMPCPKATWRLSVAGDVAAVRVGGTAPGRGRPRRGRSSDRSPAGIVDARDLHVLGGEPERGRSAPGRRSAGTPRSRAGSSAGSARSSCELVGVAQQREHAVADQVDRGLVPGDEQQR